MNIYEHSVTDKYNNVIQRYPMPTGGIGYILTVKADGVESSYDFQDSFELALEYREALVKAYESWSKEAARAERLYDATGNESGFESAGKMWAGYMMLAHNAIYPRWVEPYAESIADNCRRQSVRDPWAFRRWVDDEIEAGLLVDQEPTNDGY